jgi:perosamine synthetase
MNSPKFINIYEPNITDYSKSAIYAINSGWISNHGEFIEKSTNKLTEILKCKYAILMANGTCATHCLFLSLKFKYPEITKIYVPNNAYIAAWNSALMVYEKKQIEVMEMDINTWNICTETEKIQSLEENAAVVIVHNLGNIVNVPRLKSIRPDLIFVEDNCEGLFGKYNGIYTGTSEDILCSSASFYGNKIITTGEGGVFITEHKDVYEYIKKAYSQGMSTTRYLHDVHAYNYRMTNVQAAFLYDQLNDIDNILKNKKKIFDNYELLLEPLLKDGKISLFKKENNTENSHWIFAVRIMGNTKIIEETTDFFKIKCVDIRPFFYPINHHGHLSEIVKADETSLTLNREIIMIPSSPTITLKEQKKVVDSIYKFVFFNENIKIVKITTENIVLLDNFIPSIKSKHFRYFNKRTSECIKDHITTYLFFDVLKEVYFGYTHIDYYEKYWFGIYIDDKYRGKGFGKLLLNYTLYNACINGISEINLSVDSDNDAAINLYKKNNFIIISERDNVCYMKNTLSSNLHS